MDRKVLIKNHFEDYKGRLLKLIDEVDPNVLDQIATSFITAFKNDKTIWFCGNGGSAATASHMQVDFGYFVRYFSKRRPRVRALTDCTPIMTAIGNDNSYDALFTEQMQDNFDAGDVIICISASGNSMNVVNAAKYASELGGTSIAFVGFEGGKLNEVADISLFTPNPKGEYGPIEDLHTMIMHILVSYLEKDEGVLVRCESVVSMEINFKGKRALITGGSRGIGFEIVKCLSENGAEVVFTGTKEESCQSALRELERNGNSENIEAVAVDYLDKDNFDSFLAHDEMQKGFDIVVNNAGTNIIKPFETFEEVDYDKLMDLNFRAPWSITQAVVRGMRQKNYGRIVNISSIWGVISKPHRALYTSSKHAILGFTKTLAVEFGKHNVLTNAVSPGFTLTELTKNSLSTSEMVELGKKVPVNRMAEPIEMARTVAFLASDLNTYINGQNIVVDGGFTIV